MAVKPQNVAKFLAYLGITGRQRAKLLGQFVDAMAPREAATIAPKLTLKHYSRITVLNSYTVYTQICIFFY